MSEARVVAGNSLLASLSLLLPSQRPLESQATACDMRAAWLCTFWVIKVPDSLPITRRWLNYVGVASNNWQGPIFSLLGTIPLPEAPGVPRTLKQAYGPHAFQLKR